MYFFLSNYKKIYLNTLPIIFKFSTTIGLSIGIYSNSIQKNNKRELEVYSNLIGYTMLGMITGVTYPISFPLFTYYAFNKND